MANNVFNRSFTGNQALILAQQMKFQGLYQTAWGKWTSLANDQGEVESLTGKPMTTSSPLIMKSELERAMGDKMKVPLHRSLNQLPRIGNQQLEEHEEKPTINHMEVPINTLRHAEKTKEGKMMVQRTKDYQLAKKARPALQRHWGRTSNALMWSYAMYNRFSWNVLADTDLWAGDSTVEAVSHPHTYVAGYGKVSYTVSGSGYPSSDEYETEIGLRINNMDPSSHVLNFSLLQQLKADPAILKIEPIADTFYGDLRLLLVHPRQLITLENDSVFRDLVKSSNAGSGRGGAMDNPMLAGAKYCVDGWAIFPFQTSVFGVTLDSSTLPVYGPSTISNLNSFEDYSSYDKFGAIVLGMGAMYGAMGSQMEFIESNRDYFHVHGLAYDIIAGCARADFVNYEDGTQGAQLVNESSAVVITGAPALNFQ
jgi:hypothetical protein